MTGRQNRAPRTPRGRPSTKAPKTEVRWRATRLEAKGGDLFVERLGGTSPWFWSFSGPGSDAGYAPTRAIAMRRAEAAARKAGR